MVTDEQLPPTCAFAISVLSDYQREPRSVPEEALEAAQQHVTTCTRCKESRDLLGAIPRPKKKGREATGKMSTRKGATAKAAQHNGTAIAEKSTQTASSSSNNNHEPVVPSWASAPENENENEIETTSKQPVPEVVSKLPATTIPPVVTIVANQAQEEEEEELPAICLQCRQILPEYAEALERGQDISQIYPEIQEHLQTCTNDCPLVLELCRQIIQEEGMQQQVPVSNALGIINWELTGIFRKGDLIVSSRTLANGTLILLLLFTLLGGALGFFYNHWRTQLANPANAALDVPDGIGLSDGLQVFDACNEAGYQAKREASHALQQASEITKAQKAFTTALQSVQQDTTGCNNAEAAIYDENLHVRQSGRAFSTIVVSFDSGSGHITEDGEFDRQMLYAAYTQELIGVAIAQQQFNEEQLNTPETPLLYIVLANTTGTQSGAIQIAKSVAELAETGNYQRAGLVARGEHPILGVLGLGPAHLAQMVLPTLCQAGIPLIAPTATGRHLVDQLNATTLYNSCTPGFGLIRFSSDDITQSEVVADQIYSTLNKRNIAVFSNPEDISSENMARSVSDIFGDKDDAQVVAREVVISDPDQGAPTENDEDPVKAAIQLALQDALQAEPRPEVIFATLPTYETRLLGEELARLPQEEQPQLIVAGEFIQAATLQKLIPWTREHQLTLPATYVIQSAVSQPPSSDNWQKQFYGKFCSNFTTPALPCSNTSGLDHRALLFADGIQVWLQAIGPLSDIEELPDRATLVEQMSTLEFTGVSGPITLERLNNAIVNTAAQPVLLAVQQDGSIQVVKAEE